VTDTPANRRHNPPTAPAWSATATYAVGDTVTKDGHRWSCLIAHGTERQGTWAPGIAPTIWSDLGPA
jgi:chitodextrinase